ncbi:hypothetical protein C2G38_2187183 [Gigaspora rosea]|uniref:Uncharacterized protein n=1 Tax=Gigaspora rosea TaxID=44941 RepID=A0A397V4L3_9GLOM|nr:hypothetical protein C2G38_2187183 [Gigaspora rosea]
MESKDNFEFFEEQPLDFEVQTMIISNQNAIEMTGILVVEQPFSSLDEIDRFISLYTNKKQPLDIKVHNQNSVEMADILVVEQSQNEIDRFISSYEDNSEILEEQPLDVEVHHNDHPLTDKTNKFASKHRAFSEKMLKDIRFWTEIGNLNMRTQYRMLTKQYPNAFFLPQDLSNAIRSFKRQNHTECEAAILLNELLERKADDTRWVIN